MSKPKIVHSPGGSFKRQNFGDLGLSAKAQRDKTITESLEKNRLEAQKIHKQWASDEKGTHVIEEKLRELRQRLEDKAYQTRRNAIERRKENELSAIKGKIAEAEKRQEFWQDFSTTYAKQWGDLAQGIAKKIDHDTGEQLWEETKTKLDALWHSGDSPKKFIDNLDENIQKDIDKAIKNGDWKEAQHLMQVKTSNNHHLANQAAAYFKDKSIVDLVNSGVYNAYKDEVDENGEPVLTALTKPKLVEDHLKTILLSTGVGLNTKGALDIFSHYEDLGASEYSQEVLREDFRQSQAGIRNAQKAVWNSSGEDKKKNWTDLINEYRNRPQEGSNGKILNPVEAGSNNIHEAGRQATIDLIKRFNITDYEDLLGKTYGLSYGDSDQTFEQKHVDDLDEFRKLIAENKVAAVRKQQDADKAEDGIQTQRVNDLISKFDSATGQSRIGTKDEMWQLLFKDGFRTKYPTAAKTLATKLNFDLENRVTDRVATTLLQAKAEMNFPLFMSIYHSSDVKGKDILGNDWAKLRAYETIDQKVLVGAKGNNIRNMAILAIKDASKKGAVDATTVLPPGAADAVEGYVHAFNRNFSNVFDNSYKGGELTNTFINQVKQQAKQLTDQEVKAEIGWARRGVSEEGKPKPWLAYIPEPTLEGRTVAQLKQTPKLNYNDLLTEHSQGMRLVSQDAEDAVIGALSRGEVLPQNDVIDYLYSVSKGWKTKAEIWNDLLLATGKDKVTHMLIPYNRGEQAQAIAGWMNGEEENRYIKSLNSSNQQRTILFYEGVKNWMEKASDVPTPVTPYSTFRRNDGT